ncbi:hypothetical protein [Sutcliffiella rhizosphaerae]|uniref:Uncharacterized protein n=1 Tax=Sutcliffiella rhizosphaerae TaxID=2880967 RepID=A0ABN8ABZ0_9BACI|nr:hypothetical protein [Sutcliffiella rhizosphaerae]CAG9621731.1 hypothetical protein BACCIP111883_02504 [Sutcliffiella rhizosphaerae]
MRSVLFIFGLYLFLLSACESPTQEQPGQTEKELHLLPVSGDYTFKRYIEDKEHTEYRVLYSNVKDSNIIQVKTVQTLNEDHTTNISESNNFYEETQNGVYGYIVISEDFPTEWKAKDIEKFPKTKIISYPLEENKVWNEKIEDFDLEISYKINSLSTEVKTPAETFQNGIVIEFEEKDLNGNILRKGNMTFVPHIGWVRHEIEGEILKDVHKLVRINK